MVESLSKNKIKWINSLRLKKNRDKEGLFIVEGEKMVLELIESWPNQIEFVCTCDDSFSFKGKVYNTDEKTIKEISSLNTPNKLLAIAKKPIIKQKDSTFILALDTIQDPGNFGTIIRTADWFNVDTIICSKGTVDAYNPKVIQSSMGSLFRVHIVYLDLLDYLQHTKLPVYGALLEGANVYLQALTRKGIILMGNEGSGISDDLKPLISHPIHIPKIGGAESLNVSIATGILLSEFSR